MIWKRRLCLSITPTYMITILLNMKTVSVSVVKKVNEYCSTMYCIDDVHCICLECISDGKAAEKFEGVFIQDAESGLVSDPQKTEELFKRTPGYASWQGEYWLA